MKIDILEPKSVNVKTVSIFVKVRDSGLYTLKDESDKVIVELEGEYCPSFANESGGDYLDLIIDVDTGNILGWNKDVVSEILQTAGKLG